MAEVKRAYRLLAKAFHPDSAGEAAVPRFLAIHAAYDLLKTGRVPTAPRPPRAPTAEPWRADPARARAAREKARTPKGGASRTGTSGSGPASGGPSATDRGSAAGGATGATGSRGSTGTRGSGGTRATGRRTVRKATMGSTSYDEARDPSDATWSGASWYGPSSGEYWIVNPREYADPRKHGPEYQSRARRPLPGDADWGAEPAADAPIAATATQASASRSTAHGSPRGWADAATASAWSAPAGEPARPASPMGERGRHAQQQEHAERGARAAGAGAAPAAAAAGPDRSGAPGFAAAGPAWLGGPADDPIRRLGLALVAWPPIGLAAAAAIGEITGCAGYSAACSGTDPLLPWLAQAGILGLLLLLPPLTRILAGGAIAVLFALIPLTLFLVAIGGAGAAQGQATLAVLLGAAWVAGIAWSVMRLRGRGLGGRAA
jgi:hypothetical protein